MKKLNLNLSISVFLLSVLFGCAPDNKIADVEADIAAIKAHYDKYFIAANNNDLDLFISLWTDDGIRMEPGYNAIVGQENIRALFEEPFKKYNIESAPYGEMEVEVSGDLAYSRGTYLLKLTPKEGGPTTHFDGKWLCILKRQVDGSWKFYIDCINDNPIWSDDPVSPEILEKQDPADPKI